MNIRSERVVVHDRGRGTLRERARKHFLKEQKEMAHELSESRERIAKLLNEGFIFESSSREDHHYEIHFKNPKNNKAEDCWVTFESNFAQLESLWHGHNKEK